MITAAWPNTWISVKIDEIVQPDHPVCYGVLKPGEWEADGIPLVRVTDIRSNTYNKSKMARISSALDREFARSRIQPGDVLISVQGTVGRVAVVPAGIEHTNISRTVARIRPIAAVPSEWIQKALLAPQLQEIIQDNTGGTTRDSLNIGDLRQIELPLPPLAEQKRIVAKLDSLNAKSARARTELARIETLVARYKQAVLSKAFSGELTSAEVSNWASCTLGDLALDVRYGTAEKCTYAPDLAPVLRIPNVANGRIDLSDLKHASFNEKELRKLELLEGDLLIIRSNGSLDLVGRSAVVDAAAAGMLFAGYLIRVRLALSKAMPSFIQYWMQSFAVRRTIEDAAKSTSGVNNVNSQQLQALQLKLPPLEEQHEIVRRIESAFSKIDRLAKEAKRALQLVGRLDEAILAKAFRGELVPQDESDEPAEHLLARIRAERETAPKAKRGPKNRA